MVAFQIFFVYLHINTYKVKQMFEKPTSLRSRVLALQINEHFTIAGTRHEHTLRCHASTLGSLLGRKFQVIKHGTTSVTVFRYE